MGAPRTHRAQRVRGHTQLQRCLWQTILGFKSWPFRLWSPITSVHPREPLSHGGIGTCLCQGQAICARTFLHEFYMQRTYRSGCAHRIRVRAVKAAKSWCTPARLIAVQLGRGALAACMFCTCKGNDFGHATQQCDTRHAAVDESVFRADYWAPKHSPSARSHGRRADSDEIRALCPRVD